MTAQLSRSGCIRGLENIKPDHGRPSSGGLSRAVLHLPPMSNTPGTGSGAGLPVSAPGPALRRSTLLKPGAPGQALMPSFEHKFAARHERWSREAELDAEERKFAEKRRAEELLWADTTRRRQGRDRGGGGTEGGDETRSIEGFQRPGITGGFSEGLGAGCESERTRRRRGRGVVGVDEGKVTEMVPEREQERLTQIFGMLDARELGEVRLDEALFHMAENAQVGAGSVRHIVASKCCLDFVKGSPRSGEISSGEIKCIMAEIANSPKDPDFYPREVDLENMEAARMIARELR